MDLESLKLSKNLHHAYYIFGDPEKALEKVKDTVIAFSGLSISENPDVFVVGREVFGIDDAREVKRIQSQKNIGKRQFFIINSGKITREAQNALLKVFEEPARDTHFFIIAQEELLPTLLSRMVVIRSNNENGTLVRSGFLSLSVADRLREVQPIIAAKDRNTAERFLTGIEAELSEKLRSSRKKSTLLRAGEDVFLARRFLASPGASVKIIFEHLAGVLPRCE